MFTITEITGSEAAAILYGFIERVAGEPSILSSHQRRRLTYDSTATLSYAGTMVRNGGAEGGVFTIAKDGAFLIIVYAPHPAEFEPSVTVAGDLGQAQKFLAAFQLAGGAWI